MLPTASTTTRLAIGTRLLVRSSSRTGRRGICSSPSLAAPLAAAAAAASSSAPSSLSAQLKVDPSRLVDGLTRERLDSDPAIADYVRANFPEAFEDAAAAAAAAADEQHDDDGQQQQHVDDDESEMPMTSTSFFQKEAKPVYPRNIRPLSCYVRDPVEEVGSRRCRNMIQFGGMVPGILYGADPTRDIFSQQPESKVLVKTPSRHVQAELQRFHRHFESRVYDLTVFNGPDDDDDAGEVHRVLPRDVQRHPVKPGHIYCVNYCRYHAGRPIMVPVVPVNEEESDALKHDGFVLPIQKFVECLVEDGADIPERLELECTGLKFKEVIRTDRLIVPEGVKFSDRVVKRGREFIVGVVFGKGRGAEMSLDTDNVAAGAADAAGGEAEGGGGGSAAAEAK